MFGKKNRCTIFKKIDETLSKVSQKDKDSVYITILFLIASKFKLLGESSLKNKFGKLSLLFIGGHGGGKSTITKKFVSYFNDMFKIIDLGTFTIEGFARHHLKDLGKEENIIFSCEEIGSSIKEESIDGLKQLHDGYYKKVTDKHGIEDFSAENIHFLVCINDIDYNNRDYQALINRFIPLFVDNDKHLMIDMIYDTKEITQEEILNIKVRVQETIIDLSKFKGWNEKEQKIIKDGCFDYFGKFPTIPFLDGGRMITQFNSIVLLHHFFSGMDYKQSCEYIGDLLSTNFTKLYSYIYGVKNIQKGRFHNKIKGILTYDILKDGKAFSRDEILNRLLELDLHTKSVLDKEITTLVSEGFLVKSTEFRNKETPPLYQLNDKTPQKTDILQKNGG